MSHIFNYPKIYYAMYEKFRSGTTIREWINEVERLSVSSDVAPCDAELNRKLLENHFEVPVEIVIGEAFQIIIPKKAKGVKPMPKKLVDLVRKLGKWNGVGFVIQNHTARDFLYSDKINKFKGDMLEDLSWMFFNIFGADEGIGVREYNPVDIGDDYGVDAVGKNVNNHRCVIQVKYRHNPEDAITYADIARTFTSAVLQLKIDDVLLEDRTVYLFTTAGRVSFAFEKVMGKRCVVITRKEIATKIDNNKAFWELCFDMVMRELNP